MSKNVPITIAYGDGIGPEIMEAVVLILKEAHARIQVETVEIGGRAHHHGFQNGIPDSCMEIIRKNKILLKAPLTTPQGGGFKSVNVTLRRALGLYANVRPCISYHPLIQTKHPKMDVVIVRENEEGLYTGIEHRQTLDAYQSLKLVTRAGCEKIVKFAFDYAIQNGRKKVSCFTKDNIMKMTDGLFHKVFNEIGEFYPEIEKDHYIIDIGSARLANKPEIFDVIVTDNLYGDIISDITSEISGSVGLAGSANIGSEFAMFEAVHGSAPDIADLGIANPSGLLNGAMMMLSHIGQHDVAEKIRNAWLKTIEDGVHTVDIFNEKTSKIKVSTNEFALAVVSNIRRQEREAIKHSAAKATTKPRDIKLSSTKEKKLLIGIDVYFDAKKSTAEFAEQLQKITENTKLKLQMLESKGLKLWPSDKYTKNSVSDYWRGRFLPEGIEKKASHSYIVELLSAFDQANLDFIKTDNLYTFDGIPGFSLAQGE